MGKRRWTWAAQCASNGSSSSAVNTRRLKSADARTINPRRKPSLFNQAPGQPKSHVKAGKLRLASGFAFANAYGGHPLFGTICEYSRRAVFFTICAAAARPPCDPERLSMPQSTASAAHLPPQRSMHMSNTPAARVNPVSCRCIFLALHGRLWPRPMRFSKRDFVQRL